MNIGKRQLYPILLAICFAGCSDGGDANSGNGSTSGALRTSFPAMVYPSGPPPYGCVSPGVVTQSVMQKLNSFWQSGVVACGCDFILLSGQCYRNGFVTPAAYGYIFYDAAFLDELDFHSGSTLPADFFMAHEFGHNIQLALNLNPPGKFKELQADCLGGYYVGFQERQGALSRSELIRTFEFTCSIGDPFPSAWWATGAHGTCSERVAALQQGYNGYNSGRLPGQACP